MVHIYKDILYANIAGVDQHNCYLDLYLPDNENSKDLYGKLEQFSDKTSVENDSNNESIPSRNDDESRQFQANDLELEMDKKVTDGIYSETKESEANVDIKARLPFVLFIHGGGWRRGARAAWKHYLYFDVNFLVAFLQYFVGTYDNIGRTLASNNIPCAIVSYPLTEASWYVLLTEIMISYLQCVASVFILCVPVIGSIALYGHVAYNGSSGPWSTLVVDDAKNTHLAKTLFTLIVVLTNMITFVLFIVKRLEFEFRSSHVFYYIALFVASVSLVLTFSLSLANLAIITLILNQSMIFEIRYRRSGSSYESQVKAVAEVVRWAKCFSQNIGLTDERKLFLMGHSAGGHLATLSVFDDSILTSVSCTTNDLKGIISLSGVYDLLCLNKLLLRPAYLHPTFGRSSVAWKDASPEHRAKNIKNSSFLPKFLLMCAEKDLFLKPQSYQFSQTLDKLNLDCKHVEIRGTNHFTIITDNRTNDGSPLSYVIDFVNK